MSKIIIDKECVAANARNPGCLFGLVCALAGGCSIVPIVAAATILFNNSISNFTLLTLIPPFLAGIGLFVLARRINKAYANKLREGSFYVIQNPLNFTGEEETGDCVWTPYLYFNYDDTNGRYKIPCSREQKKEAQKGDMYYLILADEGKRGKKSVICCYPVAECQLDEQLTAMLQRDTYLSGHEMPEINELLKKYTVSNIKEKIEQPDAVDAKLPKKAPWICHSCGEENEGRVAFCIYCNTSREWSLEQQKKES